MPDLRWITGPVGCTDYVDAEGTVHGYVMPVADRTRGYALKRMPSCPVMGHTTDDRPTDAEARAWVEAEVVRLHAEGRGAMGDA